MKYIVFSSHTIKELTYLVNELLDEDEGWICQGGVSIGVQISGGSIYAQAMIKEN